MEVAGFWSVDHHAGAARRPGRTRNLDDTIVYTSATTGSAEGTLNGTFNEMINFNGAEPRSQVSDGTVDKLGGPESTTTTRWDGRSL